MRFLRPVLRFAWQTKRKSALVGAGALLAGVFGLASTWSATGCSQPPIDCRSARGDFAVQFTKIEGTCGDFTAGVVGLQSYYPLKDGKQDYSRVLLAMQSEVLGGLLQASQSYGPDFVDTKNKAYGLGEFTSIEPTDGVCTVPTLSVSEQNIPEVPGEGSGGAAATGGGGSGGASGSGGAGGAGGAGGGTGGAGGGATGSGGAGGGASGAGGAMEECPSPPEEPFPGAPATDIKIEWSNVKVYVTTEAPGTQFVADMKYSEDIDGETCSATYRLIGIWPWVDCGTYEYDDCGNLVSATPNEDACHLDPANAPPGSVVINPEFKTKCDPNLLICVPTEPVAALK